MQSGAEVQRSDVNSLFAVVTGQFREGRVGFIWTSELVSAVLS